ncbi:hypothetical protein Dimus_015265 [Dionaea muscipula]
MKKSRLILQKPLFVSSCICSFIAGALITTIMTQNASTPLLCPPVTNRYFSSPSTTGPMVVTASAASATQCDHPLCNLEGGATADVPGNHHEVQDGTALFLNEDSNWISVVLKQDPSLNAQAVKYRTRLSEADQLLRSYRQAPGRMATLYSVEVMARGRKGEGMTRLRARHRS